MPDKSVREQIEELAELQFSIEEIAIIVELEVSEVRRDYRKEYDRGRLLAQAEIRKAILQQAKQGSSPAQRQMMELIDRNKEKKVDNSLDFEL